MNIIKLEDLSVILLQEMRKRLDKKYDKIVIDDEINEIGEELNIDGVYTNLINNVVPRPEEFD